MPCRSPRRLGSGLGGASVFCIAAIRPRLCVARTTSSSRYYAGLEICRSRGCRYGRPAVIDRSSQAAITRGRSLMLGLRRGHRDMAFACISLLFGSRSGGESAGATVIADTICAHAVDNCLPVRVVDDRAIHVHDRGVVVEVVALPVSALEAGADVAESVIDTTVESDIRSPVTRVPRERPVVP